MKVLLKDRCVSVNEIYNDKGNLVMLSPTTSFIIRGLNMKLDELLKENGIDLSTYDYEIINSKFSELSENVQADFVNDIKSVLNKYSIKGICFNSSDLPSLSYIMDLTNEEAIITAKEGYVTEKDVENEDIIDVENLPVAIQEENPNLQDVKAIDNLLKDKSFHRYQRSTEECIEKATENYEFVK